MIKKIIFILFFTLSLTFSSHAKEIKIGVSIPTLANPFWSNSVKFAKHAAKELNIKLLVVGANNSEEKQLKDVQSMISAGVDAFVITPQSTAGAPGLIKIANNANIPIVIVDRHPGFKPENKHLPYLAFIGPNDKKAGKDIVNYLADKGAKKIVGIGGFPGTSVSDRREAGLKEGVKNNPNIELVQYTGAGGEMEINGYNTMKNLLSAHPSGEIDSVWCYADVLCTGAYNAIKQAKRDKEIIMGSINLMPPALKLIEKETNLLYSTGGHWLQLGFGIIVAYDKLNGYNPIKDEIQIDLLGVDKFDLSLFKNQYLDNNPPYNIKDYSLTHNPNAKSQLFELKIKE